MAALMLRAFYGALLSMVVFSAHAGDWRYNQAAGPSAAPAPAAPAPAREAMALPLPAAHPSGVNLPRSGIKLDKVRNEFGPPQQEIPAVGIPPILRWKYPEYIVYFEYDLVITSVPIDI